MMMLNSLHYFCIRGSNEVYQDVHIPVIDNLHISLDSLLSGLTILLRAQDFELDLPSDPGCATLIIQEFLLALQQTPPNGGLNTRLFCHLTVIWKGSSSGPPLSLQELSLLLSASQSPGGTFQSRMTAGAAGRAAAPQAEGKTMKNTPGRTDFFTHPHSRSADSA